MRNDVIGVIFSNTGDNLLRELTDIRCLGSVPFGGRYRLIDFVLSNMVNAGVSKVGITTSHNYRALMDHLGSGKPWDLSRKKGGIYLSPPYIAAGSRANTTRVDQLISMMSFFEKSDEQYVIICNCDCVVNMDMEDMVNRHIASGADVTVAYANGLQPRSNGERMVLTLNGDQRITDILMSPDNRDACDFSIDTLVLKKDLLIKFIKEAKSKNYKSIEGDILQQRTDTLKIYGYKINGYYKVIDSLKTYLAANMELCNREIRRELFNDSRAIFTKIRDEMPTKYGLGSSVKNCLIADGCIVDGEIENCILSRGVKIKKGAKVKNCVLMQGTQVGENADLSYVVCDKNVVITPGRKMAGFETYPVFISKDSII